MLRVGRPRTRDKDLPLGVRMVAGRYYVRPVNESMRRVFARAFPERKTAPLGADKEAMRRRWVELFCAPAARDATPGTVGAIIDRFLTDELTRLDGKTGRPYYANTTRATYTGAAKRLRAAFGTERFARTDSEAVSGKFLRPMHLQAYIRKHERTRPSAADQEVSVLKAMFVAAKQWGWTEYNPCIGVQLNGYTPREDVPSDELFLKVYACASQTLQCMMDIGQMCGPRRGSIANILLTDIRPDGLRIVANKTRRRKTPRENIYPWSDDLRAVIERAKAIRERRKGSGRVESIHLFLTAKGKPYGKPALDRQWLWARKRAGVDAHVFHFHDIRRKAGNESADELEAMRRLAHADLRMTRKAYRPGADRVEPLPAVSRKGK